MRDVLALAQLFDRASQTAANRLGEYCGDFHALIELCLANPKVTRIALVVASKALAGNRDPK